MFDDIGESEFISGRETTIPVRLSDPVNWAISILQSVVKLGIGELLSRLAMFAVLAYISRQYGLELFGAVALAQSVALYTTQATDLGFRLIGARTVAREPDVSPMVVQTLLKRRCISGSLAITATLIYAIYAPMGEYARMLVAGFVIGTVPYLFSLDWLAWGLSRFGWYSGWRGGVAIAFAAMSFIGFRCVSDPRTALVISNFVSVLLGSTVLWLTWHYRWKSSYTAAAATTPYSGDDLRWKAVMPLGITVILTQAFHNADTLLLGAMAPLSEVGRYSSAYKILFLVCGGYYLITQSLYPQFSRASSDGRLRKSIWLGLGCLTIIGTTAAIVLWSAAGPVLTIVYGSDLGAVSLLRLLVIAIPLDFIASTLGVSFVSRGFDKYVLYSLGLAALSNIVCNLILIPARGAEGAAIATLASYVVLNGCLLGGFAVLPVFAESAGRNTRSSAASSSTAYSGPAS